MDNVHIVACWFYVENSMGVGAGGGLGRGGGGSDTFNDDSCSPFGGSYCVLVASIWLVKNAS